METSESSVFSDLRICLHVDERKHGKSTKARMWKRMSVLCVKTVCFIQGVELYPLHLASSAKPFLQPIFVSALSSISGSAESIIFPPF